MDDNSSISSNSGVNEYFNQCDTIPESKNSRDNSDIIFSVNDLRPGKQIRIFKQDYKREEERERDRDIDRDIYVIVNISDRDNIEIKSTVNDSNKTIPLDRIFNIVNINPESLYIDGDFLERIQPIDPNYLNNKDALKLAFKQRLIAKLKAKKYNTTEGDSLIEYNNEKTNIEIKQNTINRLLTDISIIQNDVDIVEGIKYIRTELKGLYHIKYFKAILDALNLDKDDTILNNYIFLCECLSVTVIAGALEAGFTTHSWIYIVLHNFIKFITSSTTINNYIFLPAITIYLYTNLDTIFLSVNTTINKITQLVSTILCSISTINRIEGNIDDNITNSSESYRSSNNTIHSLSTFPSMNSLDSLYNSQIVIDINDQDKEKKYSEALTHDLEIITQDNSVYSNNSSLESYTSPPPSQPYSLGGKIKRSRVTKKHKRITIRRSKKSKKIKGGKRTRSTKKRHVGRKRKHNTKKY
jgi:hypothetical protein